MGEVVKIAVNANAVPLTFGRVLWNCRRNFGLSQRELAIQLAKIGQIDYIVLSKIENDRLNINESSWDWLIPRVASIFSVNVEWLEEIRQQTAVVETDEESPHIACFKTRPPRIKAN